MNKKEKCEKCKRTLRTSKLRKNKITKELMCLRCLQKYGENKFYNPLRNRQNKFITNYSITSDEKKVLSLRKNSKDIKTLCKGLRKMRKGSANENRLNKIKQREENIKRIGIQEKFLEGLK